MASTRSKYRGLLSKPLNPYQDLEAERAFRVRVEALFNWLEIDPTKPSAYERLAMALAFRHVPGFQFPETMEELEKARGLAWTRNRGSSQTPRLGYLPNQRTKRRAGHGRGSLPRSEKAGRDVCEQ